MGLSKVKALCIKLALTEFFLTQPFQKYFAFNTTGGFPNLQFLRATVTFKKPLLLKPIAKLL